MDKTTKCPKSQTFDKLSADGWAVQIPRSIATNRAIPFGALIVWAAACAWRERGPGWGYHDDEEDFIRTAAARPPDGWAALVGVDPKTWRKWRAHAVGNGLIEIKTNAQTRLLQIVAKLDPGEQFARVQIAALFHRELSLRARRVFVALSLFRQKDGLAAVSTRKLGDDAGLGRECKSAVLHALRELESAEVLQLRGKTARGINRYRVIEIAQTKTDQTGNFDHPPNAQTGNFDHPHGEFQPPPIGNFNHPPWGNLTTLSGTFFTNSIQELGSGGCTEPENPARAPSPVLIKPPLAKKGDEAELTDTPVETPESREAVNNEMEARISALYATNAYLGEKLKRDWRSGAVVYEPEPEEEEQGA